MKNFLIIFVVGAMFSLTDLVARRWGQDRLSIYWFAIMAVCGTASYAVFGWLTRQAEFSTAVIWTSLSLTSISCLLSVLLLGEVFTIPKFIALVLALIASYLVSM